MRMDLRILGKEVEGIGGGEMGLRQMEYVV